MGMVTESWEGLPDATELPDAASSNPEWPVAVMRYAAIRRILLALDQEPESEIPPSVVQTAQSAFQRAVNAVKQLNSSLEDDQGLSKKQIASTFEQALQEPHRLATEILRQHIRASAVNAAADSTAAREQLQVAKDVAERLKALEVQAQQIIERVGVGHLAEHYDKEADRHRKTATWWLVGVGVAVLGLAFLVAWLMHGTYQASPDTQWQVLATQAGAKAIGIGVLSYVITFCSRNYRAQLHLQAVYRQRAAALDTYTAMAIALADDVDDKRIVLAELAKAVFAAGDTGLTQSGAGDKTIIEQSVPLGSLFNAGK